MNTSTEFSVRVAKWPSECDALKDVRTRVFVTEQHVNESLEWDAFDATAVHFLAEDAEKRPIGTARLLANGQIGRMAVLLSWRNKGVGNTLLRAVLSYIKAEEYPAAFLNAQYQVIPFYQRHGFRVTGPLFEEAGIVHQRMEQADGS